MLWLELIGVVILAAAGGWAGWKIGRARRFWWLGFFLPLMLVGVVIAGHRSPRLSFEWPVSWVVDVHINPLLMAAAVPMMLLTLMVRMPRNGKRRAIGILTGVMVAYYSVLPGVCTMIGRSQLATDHTHFDKMGVCWQSRAYTCGPASAVTCLRSLGVDAQEGTIGIEARCGPVVGTEERMLASAVEELFGGSGIHATARWVGNLDDLRLPAVATTTRPGFGGHYVAVLLLKGDTVFVGDPLGGLQKLTRAEFLDEWNGSAVEIARDGASSQGQMVAQR